MVLIHVYDVYIMQYDEDITILPEDMSRFRLITTYHRLHMYMAYAIGIR